MSARNLLINHNSKEKYFSCIYYRLPMPSFVRSACYDS